MFSKLQSVRSQNVGLSAPRVFLKNQNNQIFRKKVYFFNKVSDQFNLNLTVLAEIFSIYCFVNLTQCNAELQKIN